MFNFHVVLKCEDQRGSFYQPFGVDAETAERASILATEYAHRDDVTVVEVSSAELTKLTGSHPEGVVTLYGRGYFGKLKGDGAS
jgi:hypothetical protein